MQLCPELPQLAAFIARAVTIIYQTRLALQECLLFPCSTVFTFVLKLHSFMHLPYLRLYKVRLQDKALGVAVKASSYCLNTPYFVEAEVPKLNPS